MVVVAQLVRASDCDSEGRGFEPPRLPTKNSPENGGFFFGLIFERVHVLQDQAILLPFIPGRFQKIWFNKTLFGLISFVQV